MCVCVWIVYYSGAREREGIRQGVERKRERERERERERRERER
jgi:hypothetical protein